MAKVPDDLDRIWCYQPGQTWDKTWHPVPQTVQGALLAAKAFYRKYFVPGKLTKTATLFICNRRQFDGAGGRWNHERPQMGHRKPTRIFDAITPRSWAAGELSVKEYAAALRGAQTPYSPLTAGTRLPDFSYRLALSYIDDAVRVRVIRDDDETEGEQPEAGAGDDSDNTALWNYRLIYQAGTDDDGNPLETHEDYAAAAVIDLRPRDNARLEVIDERGESGLMEAEVPASRVCLAHYMKTRNYPQPNNQSGIITGYGLAPNTGAAIQRGEGSLRRVSPFVLASYQTDIDIYRAAHPVDTAGMSDLAVFLRVPYLGTRWAGNFFSRFAGTDSTNIYWNDSFGNFDIEAPASWVAGGGFASLSWANVLPAYRADDDLPMGWYIRSLRLTIRLYAYTSNRREAPNTGYIAGGVLVTGPNAYARPLEKTEAGAVSDTMRGYIPVYDGSKVFDLGPDATSWSGSTFNALVRSHVPAKGRGHVRWAVGAVLRLDAVITLAGGPNTGGAACHVDVPFHAGTHTITARSSEPPTEDFAAQVAWPYETTPWDVAFFDTDDSDEDDGPPDPIDLPEVDLFLENLLMLLSLLLIALAALLAAMIAPALVELVAVRLLGGIVQQITTTIASAAAARAISNIDRFIAEVELIESETAATIEQLETGLPRYQQAVSDGISHASEDWQLIRESAARALEFYQNNAQTQFQTIGK